MENKVMCRDVENRLYCVGSCLSEAHARLIAFTAKKVFDKVWIEPNGLFTENEPKEKLYDDCVR